MLTPLRFFLRVLLILPLAFLAWHALGSLLAAPAVWLCSMILENWLPGAIASVSLDDTTMVVVTALGDLNGAIVPAEQAGHQLAFQLNTRVLSYSLPFFAALHFATPMDGVFERFARGLLVLWPLLTLGLISAVLKDCMVTLQETFLNQPWVPPADIIALAYQFTTLIVPPLAPIFLWAVSARNYPALRGLLPGQLAAQEEAEPLEGSGGDPSDP